MIITGYNDNSRFVRENTFEIVISNISLKTFLYIYTVCIK